MLAIFLKVLVIFLMVGTGYVASKLHLLPTGSDTYLVKYAVNIACPCLVLSSLASSELTADSMTQIVEILLGASIWLVLFTAYSFVALKTIPGAPSADKGVLTVVMVAVNAGFMGMPVALSVFGDNAFFLMVIWNVISTVQIFIVTPLQLRYGTPKVGDEKKASLLKGVISINTCSTVLGLLILFSQISLPSFLLEFLDTIGDSTVPVSMIVVGVQLSYRSLKDVVTNRHLLVASLHKMLIVPVLTFLCVNWLPLSTDAKVILILAAAMPSAVIPVSIAAQNGQNATLCSQGVALTTALSMITLPVICLFLASWYGLA